MEKAGLVYSTGDKELWIINEAWGDLVVPAPLRGHISCLGGEKCTIEAKFGLPYPTFAAIEHNAVLHSYLHSWMRCLSSSLGVQL